jgi:amino acid transporter/nucleotide-binding universal stress UspA family protein
MATHTATDSGEVTLSRELNLFTVTMIGVGGMIGAGIFVLTGIAAGEAGPAVILVFLLNGIVTSLTAMSYAELGSVLPGAGGGYIFIKEALGGTAGFLAGWMSWFAQAVAGSLYGLAFGRFAAELIQMFGLPTFGLSVDQLTLLFMTLIIIGFIFINYWGASETAVAGNFLTVTKIAILGALVVFGLVAMSGMDLSTAEISTDFFAHGVIGVLSAMGLTFIAFEGYEIIAQSGEEIINPKRNIPIAIFASIAIAVVIYILVAFVAVGGITAPPGLSVSAYLGEQGEVAIIEVADQVFPLGIGALILLLSGLASTTSALNATTFASSRVSFAMGRENNLPSLFAKIHPRRHTPYWAVVFTGILMISMAWTLPIEDVAAAASIMFLLLFMQVNLALLFLRRSRPELERGFKVPFFPFLPLLAIVTNALLALSLFRFSAVAWYFVIGWTVIGALAYFAYFSRVEEMEKPKEILHEEVLISHDYSVLVPIGTKTQAEILGMIGAIIASDQDGEVLALHVVQVPPQLSLGDGRIFLKESRPLLDEAIERAKEYEVPVHTIIRLGRKVSEAVRLTAVENASDLMVLGWPGYTNSSGKLFGSVIDPIVDNPPTDVVVVRYRQWRPLKKVLVPVTGGLNSRRAVKLAASMARNAVADEVQVTIMHVLPPGTNHRERILGQRAIEASQEGVEYPHIETKMVQSGERASAILEESKDYDLIVIGASEEPVFRNFMVGTLAERVARDAEVTVMMVKRRSSPLHSFVRQTILEPTIPKPID